MVKKTIILLVLNFFAVLPLVCYEKNILPNLTNSQKPETFFFGPELEPEPEPPEKKYQVPEPLGEKNQEPEPLEKKVRTGAAKKLAGSTGPRKSIFFW